jgi:hypothetical protein
MAYIAAAATVEFVVLDAPCDRAVGVNDQAAAAVLYGTKVVTRRRASRDAYRARYSLWRTPCLDGSSANATIASGPVRTPIATPAIRG